MRRENYSVRKKSLLLGGVKYMASFLINGVNIGG
jgi:hypothetical protein